MQRIRPILSAICFVLATILLPLSIVAFWGQRTVTHTDAFVNAIGPLPEQPAFQEAVATKVSTALTADLDAPSYVTELLGDRAAPLAGPIQAAIQQMAYTATVKLMQTEKFEELWGDAAVNLQQGMINALEGNHSGAIQLQGDNMVLDLTTVFQRVQADLVSHGITVLANKPLPAQADRQIVLFNASQLKQAQQIYALTVPIATWLIGVVFALFIAAVLLARRRPTALMNAGTLITLGGLIVIGGIWVVSHTAQNSFAGTVYAPAISVFLTQLTNALHTASIWIAILGVLVFIAGWFWRRHKRSRELVVV